MLSVNDRLLALAVIVAGALASALLARCKGKSFFLFLLLGLSFWPGALLLALVLKASKTEDAQGSVGQAGAVPARRVPRKSLRACARRRQLRRPQGVETP